METPAPNTAHASPDSNLLSEVSESPVNAGNSQLLSEITARVSTADFTMVSVWQKQKSSTAMRMAGIKFSFC